VEFKEIGWNGFLIRVPTEMHITSQGGNAKEGTFLIESEGYMIEFSWTPPPKKPKPLLTIVETIVDRAKKEARKRKEKLTVEERKETFVNNHEAVYLHLKSSIEERYYTWQCPESERLISLRFIISPFDEKARNFVKQFLSTLKCHMDEKNIWSVMKIRFEAPKSFLLSEARFAVGRAHIALTEDKLSAFEERSKNIYVDYFSMANVMFKDTYKNPEKWFEKNYLKEFKKTLKKRRINFETSGAKRLNNHRIVIKQAKKMSGLYTRSTDLCSVALWYCPEMNRMYALALNSRVARPAFLKRRLSEEEHKALFNAVLESFRCH